MGLQEIAGAGMRSACGSREADRHQRCPVDTREGNGPSVSAARVDEPLRRSVLDTREGNGPSVSSRGGGAPRGIRKGRAWTAAIRAAVITTLGVCAFARPALAQDPHLLVITGVSGDEDHAKKFAGWATKLIDGAKTKDAVPDANIVYLAEKTDSDKRVNARSTKENVEKAIADIAMKSRPDDEVFIVLIGHGSFDGKVATFNLPGPDLTAADWAVQLGKLAPQRVTFVNTTASSGAFTAVVAGPGRTIITATRTGGERNEAKFGEFFVEAFGDTSADADRNGHVSAQEAFDYAKNKVVKTYEQAGFLLTEHAVLDDGSGGKLAATQFLAAHPADGGLNIDRNDAALRALADQREAVQKQIDALKVQKDKLDPMRYDQEMEKLLTELALKTKAIRDAQAALGTKK